MLKTLTRLAALSTLSRTAGEGLFAGIVVAAQPPSSFGMK